MKAYFIESPKILRWIYPTRIWSLSSKKNCIYLTFDDGPTPNITPWILEELKKYQAKATFFCVGDNIQRYPKICLQMVSEGHSIGNHTYHHLNGWNSNTEIFTEDVLKCQQLINAIIKNKTRKILFRPPYGKLSTKQSKVLQKKGFNIIMWDILSADFDPTISLEKCLENVITNIQPGSIIVFHDSLKAEEKLRYVLPRVLDYIYAQKWMCTRI